MLYIVIFLFLIALIFFWQSGKQRREAGLPGGRVVYTDTGGWSAVERPLYYSPLKLTGKPDYLVETRAGLIPVEVKSGSAPPQAYPSHMLQLAAYCLLVEETEGRAPGYGLIKYADAVFRVEYTSALHRELLALLDAMRHARSRSDPRGVPRSHDEPRRCAGCGYLPLCDQALT